MDTTILKPYKGFLVLPRAVLLPFLRYPPQFLDFGAFIAFVSECDWDKRHSNYATIKKSDAELALRWSCDAATVWRYKQRLIKLGLLIKDGKILKVKHFEWFDMAIAYKLAKHPLATTQDLFAISQDIVANTQGNIARVQDNQGQNKPQSSNVSFKGNIGVSNDEYRDVGNEDVDPDDIPF